MPQRTDIFDLGRLGLTSGEGRRLDLHVHVEPFDYGGERYVRRRAGARARCASTSRARPATAGRCACASARALDGPCMRCLGAGGAGVRGRLPRGPPARRAATELSSPYVDDDDELDLARVGARRARARAAGPDHLPPGLRRPVPAVRREPQRGPRPRARGGAGPALGEAVRAQVRLARAGVRYPSRPPWPSLSRSSRTRAPTSAASQHKITAPALNGCPQCHRRAVRTACARNCGFYGGREVVHVHDARPRPRSLAPAMTDPVTVAVDANGADHGPAEVARGAAAASPRAASACCCSGPPARSATGADGRRGVDAPVSIAKAADPARAVRAHARGLDRRAPSRAVADGEADALVSGGSTGAALAASLFRFKRARGRPPAGAGDRSCPVPGAPFLLLDAGANVEVRPEHLVQFAHMGAAFMEAVMGVARPRVALLSNGEEATKGTEDVVAAHARAVRRRVAAELRRQRRGLRDRHRRGRRDRRRRLHRQRRAEGDGGHVGGAAGRGARAPRCRPRARSSAACCCGPRCAGCATSSTRRGQGGAVLLGLRKLGVVPHGSFGARGVRARDRGRRPRRARGRGRAHARALAGAGALRRAPRRRPRRPLACPTSHDPRRGPRADPRRTWPTSWSSTRRGSRSRRTSARTWRPTRSTSTRWCRSSRTPTAWRCPTSRRRGSRRSAQAVDFVARPHATASRGPDR